MTFDAPALPTADFDPFHQGASEFAVDRAGSPFPADARDGIPGGCSPEPRRRYASRRDVTLFGVLKDQAGRVRSDHEEFYSVEGLAWLAGGLGAGALMANTGFDEHFIRDGFLENVVFAPSDELCEAFHEPKFLGDGRYTIPVFAIAALSEPLLADLPLGELTAQWGQRSLRTILVGGPPALALQWLTGASRPGETSAEARWKPFQDNNGLSGHAFMGAIPFLSAAKMTDNPLLKAGFYTASVLPAVSRVNDDEHYFSQVFLGWWLAYVAASAVDRTEMGRSEFHLYPLVTGNEVGVLVERSF